MLLYYCHQDFVHCTLECIHGTLYFELCVNVFVRLIVGDEQFPVQVLQ